MVPSSDKKCWCVWLMWSETKPNQLDTGPIICTKIHQNACSMWAIFYLIWKWSYVNSEWVSCEVHHNISFANNSLMFHIIKSAKFLSRLFCYWTTIKVYISNLFDFTEILASCSFTAGRFVIYHSFDGVVIPSCLTRLNLWCVETLMARLVQYLILICYIHEAITACSVLDYVIGSSLLTDITNFVFLPIF